MANYTFVKLINSNRRQPEGNAVLLLPGGKKAIGVAQTEVAASGASHFIMPTGYGNIPASGALTKTWASGTRICAYPYLYTSVGPSGTGLPLKVLG